MNRINQLRLQLILGAFLAIGLAAPDRARAQATFSDDFSAGLNPAVWTVAQTTPGLFSVDDTHGDVRLAKVGTNPGGFQNIKVMLNMEAVGGALAGDFSTQIDFHDAVVGPNVDQVELHVYFADSSFFFDVYDNGGGLNVHVFNGSEHGRMAVSGNAGTFRIARVGSTVTGYYNDAPIFSTSSTSTLTGIEFALQLQPGSNDATSITFQNFSLTATSVDPLPSFSDDFSAGLDPTRWTVAQTTPGLFSVDDTQGDVRLAKVGDSPGGFQAVHVGLNMDAIGGPIAGDFAAQIDFHDAVVGPNNDQVQFNLGFGDGYGFANVYDLSCGLNVHVYDGAVQGCTSVSGTAGTFKITRFGGVLSGYYNGRLIFTTNRTSMLTAITFSLQLQPGSNDATSVTFQNFSVAAASVPGS